MYKTMFFFFLLGGLGSFMQLFCVVACCAWWRNVAQPGTYVGCEMGSGMCMPALAHVCVHSSLFAVLTSSILVVVGLG